jgi:hypothetical protein
MRSKIEKLGQFTTWSFESKPKLWPSELPLLKRLAWIEDGQAIVIKKIKKKEPEGISEVFEATLPVTVQFCPPKCHLRPCSL